MDWQAHYETGDLPWNEGVAHPALVSFLAASGPLTGRVLVPGCGLGHEVRAISTQENRVVGLDLAPGAIIGAQTFAPTGREEYWLGDFFNLEPDARSTFEWLVEHTCFCAIEPAMRRAYVAAAADALKPGGRMLAIFYLDPAMERKPPYGVAVSELDTLFSGFFTLEKEWVPARTFEGREQRELVRLLRRIDKKEGVSD